MEQRELCFYGWIGSMDGQRNYSRIVSYHTARHRLRSKTRMNESKSFMDTTSAEFMTFCESPNESCELLPWVPTWVRFGFPELCFDFFKFLVRPSLLNGWLAKLLWITILCKSFRNRGSSFFYEYVSMVPVII
jgi:hypothetical protein